MMTSATMLEESLLHQTPASWFSADQSGTTQVESTSLQLRLSSLLSKLTGSNNAKQPATLEDHEAASSRIYIDTPSSDITKEEQVIEEDNTPTVKISSIKSTPVVTTPIDDIDDDPYSEMTKYVKKPGFYCKRCGARLPVMKASQVGSNPLTRSVSLNTGMETYSQNDDDSTPQSSSSSAVDSKEPCISCTHCGKKHSQILLQSNCCRRRSKNKFSSRKQQHKKSRHSRSGSWPTPMSPIREQKEELLHEAAAAVSDNNEFVDFPIPVIY